MSERKTLEVMGMQLPVLAQLPLGWALVAHPNGPAVANAHCLMAIECGFDEETNEHERAVCREACSVYRRLTWADFYSRLDTPTEDA